MIQGQDATHIPFMIAFDLNVPTAIILKIAPMMPGRMKNNGKTE